MSEHPQVKRMGLSHDKEINHHLISNGTFYFSENDWFDPDVVHVKMGVVTQGAEYIGAFNRHELLSCLEKCSSSDEVHGLFGRNT